MCRLSIYNGLPLRMISLILHSYTDGSIVREGVQGESAGGEFSTGVGTRLLL